MVKRRTMLKALKKKGKLIYARVRVTAKGQRTSERYYPFISKTSARQIVKRSRLKGTKVKIIKFRKSSPYGRRRR